MSNSMHNIRVYPYPNQNMEWQEAAKSQNSRFKQGTVFNAYLTADMSKCITFMVEAIVAEPRMDVPQGRGRREVNHVLACVESGEYGSVPKTDKVYFIRENESAFAQLHFKRQGNGRVKRPSRDEELEMFPQSRRGGLQQLVNKLLANGSEEVAEKPVDVLVAPTPVAVEMKPAVVIVEEQVICKETKPVAPQTRGMVESTNFDVATLLGTAVSDINDNSNKGFVELKGLIQENNANMIPREMYENKCEEHVQAKLEIKKLNDTIAHLAETNQKLVSRLCAA